MNLPFYTLVLNSIDATENVQPGLRRIEISKSLAPEGVVKVAVRDNGVGLKDGDMRRLYSFSYTTKVAGTGIGLSLSQSIVQARRERRWFNSSPLIPGRSMSTMAQSALRRAPRLNQAKHVAQPTDQRVSPDRSS